MKMNKAFTLMELMVVLAIAGIIAAIGTPGIIKFLPDYRLKQAAVLLFADMQHTRMLAVKTARSHAIVFDTENNRYMVCSEKGPDSTWKTCSPEHIQKHVDFDEISSRIVFGNGVSGAPEDGVSYQNNTLVFNSRGIGSAGYVYLTNLQGTCYKVGTQSSGIVLLRRWNGTYWK